MSMLFAATHPERTRALALFGTWAVSWIKDMPSEQRDAVIDDVIARWGDGTSILRFWPDADGVMQAWWGARERLAGSPGAIRNVITGVANTDVRDALPSIQAPTLVLHSADDPMYDLAEARDLAERIPLARLVELPGRSTLPWAGVDSIVDEIEQFFTGARPTPVADRCSPRSSSRTSSARRRPPGSSATRHGRGSWSSTTPPCGGSSIDSPARRSTPQATASSPYSDGPARAIRCALGIQHALSPLGVKVRAGLHTGEMERTQGEKPRGIAVNVAARVSGLADGGETLVTATLRDLVAGSGSEFEDRGDHELKGLGESRRVYLASAGS